MNTFANPTREQAEAFLEGMRRAVLGAIDRGDRVEISYWPVTRPTFFPGHGQSPVDYQLVGARWSVASLMKSEPAAVGLS